MDPTTDAVHDDQVDDRELVAAAQNGDAAAMTELLKRHYGYVEVLCRRMLEHPQDAEDARQEALICATRYIVSFNGRSAFRTWLHAITRNVCLNMMRARKKQPRHSIHDVFDDDNDPPNRPGAFADENSVAQRLQIDAALATLPENVREVVVLRFIFEMDYAQIADELGLPLGTVKTWLRRGRTQLMSILDESREGGRGV